MVHQARRWQIRDAVGGMSPPLCTPSLHLRAAGGSTHQGKGDQHGEEWAAREAGSRCCRAARWPRGGLSRGAGVPSPARPSGVTTVRDAAGREGAGEGRPTSGTRPDAPVAAGDRPRGRTKGPGVSVERCEGCSDCTTPPPAASPPLRDQPAREFCRGCAKVARWRPRVWRRARQGGGEGKAGRAEELEWSRG